MELIAALFYRHYIVWTRRILIFLGMYILGPVIMLYGLSNAFGLEDRLSFILPGIMANAVAAGGFISGGFGAMERLMNKRYDAWLATAINIPQIVLAEALFQGFRGLIVATGIWCAGLFMGVDANPLPLFASLIPMALIGWVCAMLGYCAAATARTFADMELTDPLLTAVFVFSGVFVSVTNFAWPLQVFGMLFPIYHGIQVMRPFFVGGIEFLPMLMHLGILLAMVAASTTLAIHLFRKRLVE